MWNFWNENGELDRTPSKPDPPKVHLCSHCADPTTTIHAVNIPFADGQVPETLAEMLFRGKTEFVCAACAFVLTSNPETFPKPAKQCDECAEDGLFILATVKTKSSESLGCH